MAETVDDMLAAIDRARGEGQLELELLREEHGDADRRGTRLDPDRGHAPDRDAPVGHRVALGELAGRLQQGLDRAGGPAEVRAR